MSLLDNGSIDSNQGHQHHLLHLDHHQLVDFLLYSVQDAGESETLQHRHFRLHAGGFLPLRTLSDSTSIVSNSVE